MKTFYLVLLSFVVSVSNVFALEVPLIDKVASAIVVKKEVPKKYIQKSEAGTNSALVYFTIGEFYYEVLSAPTEGQIKVTIYETEENIRRMISNISFSRQKIDADNAAPDAKYKWNCNYLFLSEKISGNNRNSIFNEGLKRSPKSYFADLSEDVATDFVNKQFSLIDEIYHDW